MHIFEDTQPLKTPLLAVKEEQTYRPSLQCTHGSVVQLVLQHMFMIISSLRHSPRHLATAHVSSSLTQYAGVLNTVSEGLLQESHCRPFGTELGTAEKQRYHQIDLMSASHL